MNNLVNGKKGMTPEMAFRLDKAFGREGETWFPLKAAYDLAGAEKNATNIKVKRYVQSSDEG